MARSHLFVLASLSIVMGCPYARQPYTVENVAEETRFLAAHGAVMPNLVSMLPSQKTQVAKEAEQPQAAGAISSKTRSSKLVVNPSPGGRFLLKSKLGFRTRVAAGLTALFLVGLKLWQCRSAWFGRNDSGRSTAGQTSRRLAGRHNVCVTETVTTIITTRGGRTTTQTTTQTSNLSGRGIGEGLGSRLGSASTTNLSGRGRGEGLLGMAGIGGGSTSTSTTNLSGGPGRRSVSIKVNEDGTVTTTTETTENGRTTRTVETKLPGGDGLGSRLGSASTTNLSGRGRGEGLLGMAGIGGRSTSTSTTNLSGRGIGEGLGSRLGSASTTNLSGGPRRREKSVSMKVNEDGTITTTTVTTENGRTTRTVDTKMPFDVYRKSLMELLSRQEQERKELEEQLSQRKKGFLKTETSHQRDLEKQRQQLRAKHEQERKELEDKWKENEEQARRRLRAKHEQERKELEDKWKAMGESP